MTPQYQFRHWRNRGPYGYRAVVERPIAVEVPESDCSCKAGSSFEQKIKENPLVFVAGALVLGYLLAKKR